MKRFFSKVLLVWSTSCNIACPIECPLWKPNCFSIKYGYYNLRVLGQLPPRKIAREENCPPENCPLTVKFPPKIIAPAQTNSPQKVLRVNLGRLCIVCNYYCLWLKNHSTKKYFSRRQIRIKKWFTSIYLLKILNKSARSSLIREHLSLNASWFSYARTEKKCFFWKIYSEENTANFIVNNSNKIIHIWYLSSKWLSCRFIINQTTGGTSRTKLSTLL